MKEERVKKINYSERYQTRKKNYGRKRNQPTANDKKVVNSDQDDSPYCDNSDDDVYQPKQQRPTKRQQKLASLKFQASLKAHKSRANQDQSETPNSSSSKNTKPPEMNLTSKNNSKGPQDDDLSDGQKLSLNSQSNSDRASLSSSDQQENSSEDSMCRVRSADGFKNAINRSTNSLSKSHETSSNNSNQFQNTDHDLTPDKFEQESKGPEFKKVEPSPDDKNESNLK